MAAGAIAWDDGTDWDPSVVPEEASYYSTFVSALLLFYHFWQRPVHICISLRCMGWIAIKT